MAEPELIVDCTASAPIVRIRFVKNLGVSKVPQRVNIRQGDRSYNSVGNSIVNTSFNVYDLLASPTSATVLHKFSINAEVLKIVHKDYTLALS